MSATVRVAVVQAAPVVLDASASVDKACDLIGEAGAGGARLIALPEVFVSLYPSSRWAYACARFTSSAAELHRRMWDNAVDVPGPLTERLGTPPAARVPGLPSASTSAIPRGREPCGTPSSGSPPTAPSPTGTASSCPRSTSASSGARAPATTSSPSSPTSGAWAACSAGRTSCPPPASASTAGASTSTWPRRPTTARSGSPPCAPSPSRRARSCSRRSSTSGATTSPTTSRFPDELGACPEELLVGNSMIVDPWGTPLAGPVAGREEILYADCDMGAIIAARRVFDVAGHYRRPDIEVPEPLRAEAETTPVAPGTGGDRRGG